MAATQHWNLRNLYLYLVCFVTLIITIFAAVSLVRSTVELLYPDPGYYGPGYYGPDRPEEDLSEEEAAEQQRLAEQSQRRYAVLSLVGSGTTLLISVPLYVYHWRRIERELPAEPQASSPVP